MSTPFHYHAYNNQEVYRLLKQPRKSHCHLYRKVASRTHGGPVFLTLSKLQVCTSELYFAAFLALFKRL